MARLNLAQAVP